MEITLSKPYLNHTAGDTIEVTAERGRYLVRAKVAQEHVSKKEYKEPKGKKLKEPRKDGVSTVFTPEEHDKHIKHLNKDL
jgi:hypothetical protein